MNRVLTLRFRIGRHRAKNASTMFSSAIVFGIALGIVVSCALPAWSSDVRSATSMQSLDQQVQDIKSDVLSISAELRALEEQLLNPSSTQVSVFVEIGNEQDVRVDSAHVSIDGETVAHHVYTHSELEALQKGGIQRLYTGNLREGEHTLRVKVEGRRTSTGRFDSSEEFVIHKTVGPKKVGVTLSDSLTGGAQVAIADW